MAKILTLEEAMEADIFWFESRGTYSSEYGRVCDEHHNSIAIERLGFTGFAFEDSQFYGSWWRCWDSKPTDEQRKSEPWKED